MTEVEPSASDRAYVQLRGLLTSDGVGPGEPLREVAIADWLGVSRTPVRAALQRLEMEQLVRRRKNGYVVASLKPRDVRETCDALRLVDTALFQRAAERLTDDDHDELTRCVEQMRAGAEAGDVELWSAGDDGFHELLGRLSDHALFSHIASTQRRRLQRFWKRGVARGERLETCAAEHAEIVAAIASSDDGAIARLVNDHIDHMQESLLSQLEVATPFLPNDDWNFDDD